MKNLLKAMPKHNYKNNPSNSELQYQGSAFLLSGLQSTDYERYILC